MSPSVQYASKNAITTRRQAKRYLNRSKVKIPIPKEQKRHRESPVLGRCSKDE